MTHHIFRTETAEATDLKIEAIYADTTAPLEWDCPTCNKVTSAHLHVDTRDCGSGITWVVCDECYGRTYDGGMWDLGDADTIARVRIA